MDAAAAAPAGAAAAAAAAASAAAAAVPFSRLCLWSSVPVAKVLLMGLAGAALAREGALGPEGRQLLSRLIFLIFTPALTFDKLAPALSASNLVHFLPLPLNVALSIAVGLALGAALARTVSPPWFARHTIAATGLGNVGNLPLVLVAALASEAADLLGPGATPAQGVAFVALGIIVANVSHFTIGLHLLRLPSPDAAPDCGPPGAAAPPLAAQQPPAPDARRRAPRFLELSGRGGGVERIDSDALLRPSAGSGGCGGGCAGGAAAAAAAAEGQSPGRGGWPQAGSGGWPAEDERAGLLDGAARADSALGGDAGGGGGGAAVAPAAAAAGLDLGARPHWSSGGGSCGVLAIVVPPLPDPKHPAGAAAGAPAPGRWPPPPARPRWRARLRAAGAWAGGMVSPPLVASATALAVGLCPPARDALFAPDAPLGLVRDVIAMFGDCCIPALMLMVGATLERGPGRGALPRRTIAAVAAARLVLLPLLGVGWVLAARAAGLLPASTPRLVVLVMLCVNSVPTALNVHTLCTMHGNCEAEMGAVIFYEYVASIVTVPLFLALFLHVCQAYF
ncbi:auxin efflux carrier family protein [Raphidocelis subcapitata]|uniref:Auxin efflux carrier family protein n=1 Tax=Raphidocelis subcapitata TaxID=307507 RepID=A0A2V0P109_9CHLO|nr:auxin efflux carrier family protein [Raphidocelis subcapitata]|eukprot:GBF90775.1 auxin efflux carrier family protein [Raphidocelis subcapitata]